MFREFVSIIHESKTNIHTKGSKAEADLQHVVNSTGKLDQDIQDLEGKHMRNQAFTDEDLLEGARKAKDIVVNMKKGVKLANVMKALFKLGE